MSLYLHGKVNSVRRIAFDSSKKELSFVLVFKSVEGDGRAVFMVAAILADEKWDHMQTAEQEWFDLVTLDDYYFVPVV